jgi:GTP:adenosylcobinamide-phosphate guanylyltransferase
MNKLQWDLVQASSLGYNPTSAKTYQELQPLLLRDKTPRFTALVLAGRRGPTDPIAQTARCSHKVLVPVCGIPMLVRVLRTLRAARSISSIVVSTDDPSLIDGLPELRTFMDPSALSYHGSVHSPAASTLDYFEKHRREPLLVATADHPLLTAEMVDHFCSAAAHSGADVAVGVVAASLFRAHYPTSKRSFIPLRSDSFCGTNLFALLTPQAAVAAAFWTHAGQFRKRPWRLIREFGLINLGLLALRRLDLTSALVRASRVIGARIAVVQMPFPECAIDVDNLEDFATATRILRERETGRY